MDHGPRVLADVEFSRAHQVAHVLNEDQIQAGKRQADEGRPNHGGIEVTLSAEAITGVDQLDGGAHVAQAVGVETGLDVAFDDRDSKPIGELAQGLA